MATGGTSREPSSFGSLVRHSRVAAGLTQEQLAARAGLSPDTIALLERGKRHIPRAGTVRLLADALALGAAERAAFLAAARPEPARAGAADSGTETEAAPPLRYLATPATPLIDRADELASIVHWLTCEDVRLLTLVGPAGWAKRAWPWRLPPTWLISPTASLMGSPWSISRPSVILPRCSARSRGRWACWIPAAAPCWSAWSSCWGSGLGS